MRSFHEKTTRFKIQRMMKESIKRVGSVTVITKSDIFLSNSFCEIRSFHGKTMCFKRQRMMKESITVYIFLFFFQEPIFHSDHVHYNCFRDCSESRTSFQQLTPERSLLASLKYDYLIMCCVSPFSFGQNMKLHLWKQGFWAVYTFL